jgi:hypothetical protein
LKLYKTSEWFAHVHGSHVHVGAIRNLVHEMRRASFMRQPEAVATLLALEAKTVT